MSWPRRRSARSRHASTSPRTHATKLVELLNARLADSFDLYSQLKQAHWNVKGSDFIQLHALYDDVAESVLEFVDMIAERATALGGSLSARRAWRPRRRPSTSTRWTRSPGKETVEVVADRLATFGAAVRAAIDASDELGDQDTADLFTEVSRAIDKHLWFVEAHLQAVSRRGGDQAGSSSRSNRAVKCRSCARLLDDSEAPQLAGSGGDGPAHLDHVVHVALRVRTPGDRQAHEVERGRLLGAVGVAART